MASLESRPSEQLNAEHHSIRGLLQKLEIAVRLDELVGLLGDLRGSLKTHFEFEESDDGLPAVVREYAPQRMPELEALFEEHAAITSDLDALRKTAEACLDRRDVLVGRIREHEAKESELLSTALYDDPGGSG